MGLLHPLEPGPSPYSLISFGGGGPIVLQVHRPALSSIQGRSGSVYLSIGEACAEACATVQQESHGGVGGDTSDCDLAPSFEPFMEDSSFLEATSGSITTTPCLLADPKSGPIMKGNLGGAADRQISAALVPEPPVSGDYTPSAMLPRKSKRLANKTSTLSKAMSRKIHLREGE